jgi:hypothetical protein
LVDNSQNKQPSPEVSFFWMDEANYPPWITDSDGWTGPPPNKLRQATSWEFTLWEVGGPAVFDATVPLGNENVGDALVQYDYTGELNGPYTYEITAFNNYGSASTPKGSVTISLASLSPTITVTALGSNSFRVQGTGFTPNGQVNVNVNESVRGTALPKQTTNANPQGGITIPKIDCKSLCPGRDQLLFKAIDAATNTLSNLVQINCS